MGEYTVALTTLDIIDLEAGLATEHPNQTLTASILRTITRWVLCHEPLPFENLEKIRRTKAQDPNGASLTIQVVAEHMQSKNEEIKLDREDTATSALLKAQRQQRWTNVEIQRQEVNMTELATLNEIGSPRHGQTKRRSPSHSPTRTPGQTTVCPGGPLRDPVTTQHYYGKANL
ncbi:unnamed protein product [Aphanomyces euteiches]|nr:hypothetical protein AeRB84_004749 [Aphanomyces euteiches]